MINQLLVLLISMSCQLLVEEHVLLPLVSDNHLVLQCEYFILKTWDFFVSDDGLFLLQVGKVLSMLDLKHLHLQIMVLLKPNFFRTSSAFLGL